MDDVVAKALAGDEEAQYLAYGMGKVGVNYYALSGKIA